MSAEFEEDRVPREESEANWPSEAEEQPEEFEAGGQAAAVGAVSAADSSQSLRIILASAHMTIWVRNISLAMLSALKAAGSPRANSGASRLYWRLTAAHRVCELARGFAGLGIRPWQGTQSSPHWLLLQTIANRSNHLERSSMRWFARLIECSGYQGSLPSKIQSAGAWPLRFLSYSRTPIIEPSRHPKWTSR
jgi:hypothetical protein